MRPLAHFHCKRHCIARCSDGCKNRGVLFGQCTSLFRRPRSCHVNFTDTLQRNLRRSLYGASRQDDTRLVAYARGSRNTCRTKRADEWGISISQHVGNLGPSFVAQSVWRCWPSARFFIYGSRTSLTRVPRSGRDFSPGVRSRCFNRR